MKDRMVNKTTPAFYGRLGSTKEEVATEIDKEWASAKQGESAVHSPKHYAVFDGGIFDDLDVEAIEVIARSMTVTEFGGYCKGSILKYRLRAGKKDRLEQDISKCDKYQKIFNLFVPMCYDYKEQLDSINQQLKDKADQAGLNLAELLD